jgi:hypothetical protein
MAVTGGDDIQASTLLAAMEWNLESAINLFVEVGPSSIPGSSLSASHGPHPMQGMFSAQPMNFGNRP